MIIDKTTLTSDAQPDHGKGQLMWWINQHATYKLDCCLIWPFSRTKGYGTLRIDGKRVYAHRVMCEAVNGPPPTEAHQAAHSCGRGEDGCVNPKHVSWKTHSENMLDRREHGTQARGRVPKLNFETAEEIRALSGLKTQRELADRFGVTPGNINHILKGKTWTKPRQHKSFWRGQQEV